DEQVTDIQLVTIGRGIDEIRLSRDIARIGLAWLGRDLGLGLGRETQFNDIDGLAGYWRFARIDRRIRRRDGEGNRRIRINRGSGIGHDSVVGSGRLGACRQRQVAPILAPAFGAVTERLRAPVLRACT
ncbi:hypothetical protein RZS08_22110, partial [Arthrospira platensis SPKY1]|nr:hypothetical protein [Arthrospira platensis SPKY1]